jgi:hypothetical protein
MVSTAVLANDWAPEALLFRYTRLCQGRSGKYRTVH